MLDRVDPQFRALPLAALADAALDRARVPRRPARRHARRADRHPDHLAARRRGHRRRRRDGGRARRPRARRRCLGLRLARRPHPRTGGRHRRAGRPGGPHPRPGRAGAGRARRRARPRRRGLGLGLHARPVRRADPRQGRPAHRVVAAAARVRRRRPRPGRRRPGPRVQVLRRPRGHLDDPAAGAHRPHRHRDRRRPGRGRLRDHGLPRRPRRPGLGVPHRRRLGLRRRARHHPRAARREDQGARASSRARTTWSSTRPTSGSPSTSRSATPPSTTAPSATRPPTRAPASPPPTSSARCATAPTSCTSRATARSTTAWPRVGFDDDGVATTEWDLVRDGVLVGYQLDRTFAPRLGLTRSNGCAFADSPHHVPIQRMANVSLQPAPTGRHHRRPHRRRRARHLRRRRQVLVDRHAALQLPVHRPALLPDRERRARRVSCATSPTRPPPRTSGARSTASAARRPGCSAAR